jgi:hypothetical protein
MYTLRALRLIDKAAFANLVLSAYEVIELDNRGLVRLNAHSYDVNNLITQIADSVAAEEMNLNGELDCPV